ncbi:anthocyanidin-3-O-glucoside rhamnosyltransferase-like [Solanum stenotomum]|uniref:anthocyanidin-3-O-glucoside rhamnosyltransferase-like n=1 Tax=Solanum stenotomum TaxID=172797 RepID=UPI0020D182F5|nr:anthocyanidin-3-O-glucoside rhamnosyltransferase-like [Solanum stenotomum]
MAKQVTELLSTLRVLMFPFLAYGHISPFLNVAKKLADREFLIYLCSTPINLKYASKKIPEKYADSIQLVELHLPELPELPPHYHTTYDLPHHLHHTLQKALKMSKPNFSKILENLKPDLVIYDILQQWAERVANEHNIPAVKLLTSGETGENLRAKVRDISKNLKSVRGEEMDAAAQELIQLCRNSEYELMNARLIVELGVAVEIIRDDDGNIHRGEITETLKDVITGETGEILRGKVRDISKNLKSIREEEMDTAAEELIQLCRNSNKYK